MSSYTPIITYGPKDALAHGDPNKAIKGAQLDNELSAISTAITGKLDSPLSNIAIGGVANSPAATITANSTTNQSLGVKIKGGTNSTDYGLYIQNSAGATTFLVKGDGTITGGPSNLDVTPTGGTFSVTMSGALVGSITLAYWKMGPIVRIYTLADHLGSNGVSNVAFVATALPAAIRPSVTTVVPWFNYATGTSPPGFYSGNTATITSGGVITMRTDGFVNNTTMGFSGGSVILEYFLQ